MRKKQKKGICDFEWKEESQRIRKHSPTYQERIYLFKKLTKNIKGRVLDDGCGGDNKVLLLPKTVNYIGIDLSKVAVSKLKGMGYKAKVMDATKLKFKENSFDYVLSFMVLEHIDNDLAYLKEAHRVLKPDGKLFFNVVLGKKYWSPIDERFGHYRRYELSELKELMEKAGFKITKKYFGSVFLNFFYRLFSFYKAKKKREQFIPNEESTYIFLLDLLSPLFKLDRLFHKVGFWGMEIFLIAEKK